VFAHFCPKVGVGGGDDAYVGLPRTAFAEAFECVLLQHAQQFHLAAEVEVADFVKEYGTFVGKFEAPLAVGGGTGVGTFYVTEHLAFEKRL
jgi:hypothetical protein